MRTGDLESVLHPEGDQLLGSRGWRDVRFCIDRSPKGDFERSQKHGIPCTASPVLMLKMYSMTSTKMTHFVALQAHARPPRGPTAPSLCRGPVTNPSGWLSTCEFQRLFTFVFPWAPASLEILSEERRRFARPDRTGAGPSRPRRLRRSERGRSRSEGKIPRCPLGLKTEKTPFRTLFPAERPVLWRAVPRRLPRGDRRQTGQAGVSVNS